MVVFEISGCPCQGNEEQCGDHGQGVHWQEDCNAFHTTKALAA